MSWRKRKKLHLNGVSEDLKERLDSALVKGEVTRSRLMRAMSEMDVLTEVASERSVTPKERAIIAEVLDQLKKLTDPEAA